MNPDFYKRFMIGDVKVDYYLIAMLYEVNDPCISHILKKALRCGRSHKSIYQDVQDIIDTAKRWQTLNPPPNSQPMVAMNVCEETGKSEMITLTDVKVYRVIYFPCKPSWLRDEVAFTESWSKPGWYIIEVTLFDSALGDIPYDDREQALAHANFTNFHCQ